VARKNKKAAPVQLDLPIRTERVPFQCLLEKDVFVMAKRQKKNDGLTWEELVEGLLKRYIEERQAS